MAGRHSLLSTKERLTNAFLMKTDKKFLAWKCCKKNRQPPCYVAL